MHKVIDDRRNKEMRKFGNISVRDFFEYNDMLFLKIGFADIPQNAINLTSQSISDAYGTFMGDEMVHVVDIELHIVNRTR